ncbi:MAG: addiction module antidote protein [Pelistega sp.]|nr:addiction module antidote protein [Pelistega sp.]
MKKNEITPFDVADYLTDEETIQEYLQAILEENDLNLLLAALGDIAKARGMSEIAMKSGLSRESLYKSLSRNSKPRLETIQKVLIALGFSLSIKALPKTNSHAL